MADIKDIPTTEGTIPFTVPSVKKPCSTYYKTFGELSCGKPPVIVLHGGPGAGSGFVEEFGSLWPKHGLPVIVYDQIGCGKSTNLDDERDGDESFWVPELFIAELENLLDHFGMRESGRPGFFLFGLSWGAMLGAEFATLRPQGLRGLILACPVASQELFIKGMAIRVSELPQDAQDAINEGIRTQDASTDTFKKAYRQFVQHAVIRVDPLPPAFEWFIDWAMTPSRGVNSTMFGKFPIPSRAHDGGGGSLRDFNVIPRLHLIEAPTLVINGEHDQSHDVCVAPFFENIPKVRWYTIPGASHCQTWEGEPYRGTFYKLIGDFLTQLGSKDAAEK
ncbi:hypothetical protein ANO11243_080220 [Dothideomycetidae sp. 11243]|nr:hypothetical protein ANO11243_080220 [fungal sp. No.11243]